MNLRVSLCAAGLLVGSALSCKPSPAPTVVARARTAAEIPAETSVSTDASTAGALPARVPPAVPSASPEQLQRAARSLNEFGFALFSAMNRGENALISPLDIGRALSMMELGSDGVTREELDHALRVTAGDGVIDALPALRVALERSANRPGFALSSGARVWPATTFSILDSYRSVVGAHFGADLVALDYARDPEAQRRTINAWVSQQTRTRIPELVPSSAVNTDTRFMLTTALYFLGRWASTFDERETREELFYLGNGQAKRVPMMSGPLRARYHQDGDARLLELAYQGDELVMDIVIPAPRARMAALLPRIDAAHLAQWSAAATQQSVAVSMPRFTLRKQSLMRGALQQLGVQSLFGSPNLSRLTSEAPPAIGEVIHEVFVDVNETGTEAAAATAIAGYGSGGPTPLFAVNQHFVFAIRHRPTGAVLFLGNVVDPKPDAPTETATGAPFEPGAADPMNPAPTVGLMGRGTLGPVVRASPPTVRGTMSPEAIRRVVLRNLGRIAICHERVLHATPSAEGRVVAHFSINAAGTTSDVRVDGEYPVPSVFPCVQSAFRAMQFPSATDGEVSVDYPIAMNPIDTAGR